MGRLPFELAQAVRAGAGSYRNVIERKRWNFNRPFFGMAIEISQVLGHLQISSKSLLRPSASAGHH